MKTPKIRGPVVHFLDKRFSADDTKELTLGTSQSHNHRYYDCIYSCHFVRPLFWVEVGRSGILLVSCGKEGYFKGSIMGPVSFPWHK